MRKKKQIFFLTSFLRNAVSLKYFFEKEKFKINSFACTIFYSTFVIHFSTMGIIQRQGIQNTIITYVGIFIGFLNLLVVQPYFLTAEEIGLTRVLFSFSSLLAVVFPLGVGHITIRYFPHFRDREKRHHGFFGLVVLLSVIGYVLMAAALFFLRDFFIGQYQKESPLFTEYFDYVFPFSFFIGLVTVLNVYAYALFKTTFPSLLNDVAVRIFTIIVISVYFLKILTLQQFIFVFVTIYALQLVILVTYIFKVDKPGLKINFEILKQHKPVEIMQYGLLLSVASIASLGLKYLDSIMIAKYLPLAQVGIYTVAVFIPTVIEAPLNSLEKISITKTASALVAKNMNEVKEIYYKSSRYMMLLGGLLFLGININISYLLAFLPSEYAGGETVVLIVSVSAFFTMMFGTNTAMIFNSEHYRYGVFLLIFLVLSAFLFNIVFIPKFGIEGAAFATAISAVLYALLKYFFILAKYKLQPFNLKTFYVLILVLACLAINSFLPETGNRITNILIHSSIITVIYISIVYFLKIVPEFHKYIPFLKSPNSSPNSELQTPD